MSIYFLFFLFLFFLFFALLFVFCLMFCFFLYCLRSLDETWLSFYPAAIQPSLTMNKYNNNNNNNNNKFPIGRFVFPAYFVLNTC